MDVSQKTENSHLSAEVCSSADGGFAATKGGLVLTSRSAGGAQVACYGLVCFKVDLAHGLLVLYLFMSYRKA